MIDQPNLLKPNPGGVDTQTMNDTTGITTCTPDNCTHYQPSPALTTLIHTQTRTRARAFQAALDYLGPSASLGQPTLGRFPS